MNVVWVLDVINSDGELVAGPFGGPQGAPDFRGGLRQDRAGEAADGDAEDVEGPAEVRPGDR